MARRLRVPGHHNGRRPIVILVARGLRKHLLHLLHLHHLHRLHGCWVLLTVLLGRMLTVLLGKLLLLLKVGLLARLLARL